jgi:chromosome segregation ATPase
MKILFATNLLSLLFVLVPQLSAETLSNEALLQRYSSVDTQLAEKSSDLSEVTRTYGALRKEVRDIEDEIERLQQSQHIAQLNIKKIEMFSDNDLSEAEKSEQLRKAKYEKRVEQVQLQQLQKKRLEKQETLETLGTRKNRLERAVTSLREQHKELSGSIELQNLQEKNQAAADAMAAKAAKEAARQRWLEKERIRKEALAAQQKQQLKAKPKPRLAQVETEQQRLEREAKQRYLAGRLSDAEALRQQQALMQIEASLPSDLRAIVNAKIRALSPTTAEPTLGYLAELQLKNDAQQSPVSLGYFQYLGNQQYMHTFVLREGFHEFIIGSLKYSKHVSKMYDNSKAILIVNALDLQQPVFELYPASRNEFDLFSF